MPARPCLSPKTKVLRALSLSHFKLKDQRKQTNKSRIYKQKSTPRKSQFKNPFFLPSNKTTQPSCSKYISRNHHCCTSSGGSNQGAGQTQTVKRQWSGWPISSPFEPCRVRGSLRIGNFLFSGLGAGWAGPNPRPSRHPRHNFTSNPVP